MEPITELLSFSGGAGIWSDKTASGAIPLILTLCIIGTLLVTRIIGRESTFEYAFTFTGLLSGALIFDHLLENFYIPQADQMTQTIAVTVLGMSVSSIFILLYYRILKD